MGEGFIGVLTAPWAPAIAAYLFGMATGWLIWGGRKTGAETDTARTGDLSADIAADAPAAMKLGAVESEIKAAKSLIEENSAEAKELAAELSTLDEAIKRANGRVKLVVEAVKKAARRSAAS